MFVARLRFGNMGRGLTGMKKRLRPPPSGSTDQHCASAVPVGGKAEGNGLKMACFSLV